MSARRIVIFNASASERTLRASTSETYLATMQREFGDWFDMELRRITPKVFQARFSEVLARTPAGAALAVRTFKSCWSWARADVTDRDGVPVLPECPANIVKAKKMMPKAKRKQRSFQFQVMAWEEEGMPVGSGRCSPITLDRWLADDWMRSGDWPER